MILFISTAVAVIAFSVLYRKFIDAFSHGGISLDVELSRGEVFEGEEFILRETVTNNSAFPVSALRVDLSLPEGIDLVSSDEDKKRGYTPYISSLFVLKSRESVTLERRIYARHRGVYTINKAITVKRSLFGLDKISERIDIPASAKNSIVVYPEIISLREYFTTSHLVTGNALSRARLVRDPLMIAGVRQYTAEDPMNRINWKISAAHSSLYVNNEEFSERYELDILLNMQSRSRERGNDMTAYPESVDLCVNVAAAILDKCVAQDIPVSVITNGNGDTLPAEFSTRDNGSFTVSPSASGRDGIFSLVRFLAGMQNVRSCATYDMLAEISDHPSRYCRGRNLVIVSAYFDSFLEKFHREMASKGYSLVYYITTAYREAVDFPIDAEIHYKIRKTESYYE